MQLSLPRRGYNKPMNADVGNGAVADGGLIFARKATLVVCVCPVCDLQTVANLELVDKAKGQPSACRSDHKIRAFLLQGRGILRQPPGAADRA